MDICYKNQKLKSDKTVNSLNLSSETIEIVLLEEKKLVNMLLAKTLHTAISSVRNLKNLPLKFSSFQNVSELCMYLENKNFGKLNLFVFSDRNYENEINANDLLFKAKQKGINITMMVMDGSEVPQTSFNARTEEENLIMTYNTIPSVSSQTTEKMVM